MSSKIVSHLRALVVVNLLLGMACSTLASPQTLDGILAIVGRNVVLQSQVETQFHQIKATGGDADQQVRCDIYEDLLFQQALLDQAMEDSLEVDKQRVEGEMDRRIAEFVSIFGSEEALEDYYGKSIVEIKEEFRDLVKDQLLTQDVRASITQNIKVTPAEVKKYYHSLSKDSLPLVNAQVQVSHILRKPPIGEWEKNAAKQKLIEIKQRVDNGEDFGTLAYLYSEDPGSAKQNGELGMTPRESLVPEFVAAALKLKPGEVSGIVSSPFGYHLIQLIERKGNRLNARHILSVPKVKPEDLVKEKKWLDSVATVIQQVDSITFESIAQQYSSDEDSKNNAGIIPNPINGTTVFDMDQLSQIDPSLFFVIDGLGVGETSKPVLAQLRDGSQGYRLVKLLRKTAPHRASLEQDYQLIQERALYTAQEKVLSKWLDEKIARTYIEIKDDQGCRFNKKWGEVTQ